MKVGDLKYLVWRLADAELGFDGATETEAPPREDDLEFERIYVTSRGIIATESAEVLPITSLAMLPSSIEEMHGPDGTVRFLKEKLVTARELSAEKTYIPFLTPGFGNYYHLLIDMVPRALASLAKDPMATLVMSTYQLEEMKRWSIQRVFGEVMAQLFQGIEVEVFEEEVVSIPRALVPRTKHRYLGALIARSPNKSAGTRRIYISRQKCDARKVVNEEALRALLEAEGIVIVTLEEMAFKEQIELFSEVALVIAPHGAGLGNLVFSPQETVIVELLQSSGFYKAPIFREITARKHLNHLLVECESSPDAARSPGNAGIIVDAERVARAVSWASSL